MPTSGGSGPTGPHGSGRGARPGACDEARTLAETVGRLLPLLQFRERDRLAPYALTPTQWAALRAVVDADGLTVNQLAGALYVEKSTASRIASGLVDRELVARRADPGDGRGVRLTPTDAARRTYAGIAADEERDYAVLFTDVAAAERTAIRDALRELTRQLATGVRVDGGSCSLER